MRAFAKANPGLSEDKLWKLAEQNKASLAVSRASWFTHVQIKVEENVLQMKHVKPKKERVYRVKSVL